MTQWLLDLEIDGRTYRWSTSRIDVAGDIYEAGLGDLELTRGQQDAPVTVLDPVIDWPALSEHIEGRAATLTRWDGDEAEVYVRGEAYGLVYGSRLDAISFSVGALPSLTLGQQVPDPLSRVDESTWPQAGGPEIGDTGRVYPVILGYPGHISASVVVPVVPVPLAQSDATTALTYVVVCDDVEAVSLASVLIRNQTTDTEATETVVAVSDLLGRQILCADFTNDISPWPVTGESHDLYAGFSPAGGGGAVRDVYSVLRYMLRRGRASADLDRIAELRDLLGQYQVDTWIDDPLTDAWAWFEAALMPDLPVAIRTTTRGQYLVERRYASDPRRRVGTVDIDAGDGAIIGSVTFDGRPVNEIVGYFRSTREVDWLGQIILTGSDRPLASPATIAPTPGDSQTVTVVRSGPCSASQARYGLMQGEPSRVDWTWDEGTLLRVLEVRASREALPARLASYRLNDHAWLQEGDEVLLTDTPRGFVGSAAIVDAPPLVSSSGVVITFRLPRSA